MGAIDSGMCPGDLVCVRADTGACGTRDMADICLPDVCEIDGGCSNMDICFGVECDTGLTLCPPVMTVQCRNNVIFSNCSTDDKVATRQDYNTNTTFQAFSSDLNKILTTEDYTNNAYDLDNFVRNLGPSNEAILRRNIGRLCMPDETGYFIQD